MTSTRVASGGPASVLAGVTTTSDENQIAAIDRSSATATAMTAIALLALCITRSVSRELGACRCIDAIDACLRRVGQREARRQAVREAGVTRTSRSHRAARETGSIGH